MQHIYLTRAAIFRKDLESVLETMLTDKFGPARYRHTREFEKELCKFFQDKIDCVVVDSGTSALHLALLAYGIKPDDEIIIPSYSESAILHACSYVGAKPVIVDINHNNYGINLEATQKAITQATKLIYIPHLFGVPVDISIFQNISIPILEDITQSLGAEFKEKRIGTEGLMSICSFTDEKMITTAQGGVILSKNKELISKCRKLTEYKNMETYEVRYNYRLCDLLAALGLNQIKYLPRYIEKRRLIAEEYDNIFKKAGLNPFSLTVDRYNVFYKYILILEGKLQKVINHLKKVHIESEPAIRIPLHRLLKLDPALYPNTEKAWYTSLSLPIYPTMKKNEIERVAKEVIRALEEE